MKGALGDNAAAASEAGTIIKDASKRLSQAFAEFPKEFIKRGQAEEYFTSAELQQLRTIYGVNTSKITNVEVSRLKRILAPTASTKRAWNDIKKGATSLFEGTVNAAKSVVESVGGMLNLPESEKKDIASKLNISYNKDSDNNLYTGFSVSLKQVRDMYLLINQNFAVRDATLSPAKFVLLVEKIEEVQKIIGEKKGD
jgi:hypothetical protein